MPQQSPVIPDNVRNARLALFSLFLLAGASFSSWITRLPAVRSTLELSEGQLGFMLLFASVGSLVTVPMVGSMIMRWGAVRLMRVSAFQLAGAMAIMGFGLQGTQGAIFGAGLFLLGMSTAISNVSMNLEASGVERKIGRTILPRFHAAFSVGAVAGSGIGALCALLNVSLVHQLAVTAVIAAVLRYAAAAYFLPPAAPLVASRRRSRQSGVEADRSVWTSRRAWAEPRTLLIGLIALSSALGEGAANDWIGIAIVDGFNRSETLGALSTGLFLAAMTVVRVVGTSLIDKYGRVTILRCSMAASMAGLLLFIFANAFPLAVLGIAIWGAGTALNVPIGMAAAADDPVRAAARLSVTSSFASMAFLTGPPLIGMAAEQFGTRNAMIVLVVTMVLSFVLAKQVGPVGAEPSVDPAAEPSVDPAAEPSVDPAATQLTDLDGAVTADV